MTTDRLVTLPFASLGPQIWTEAAVEGGRTTVDESLTALPGPVYFHPPGGATCTRPLSYPGPPWGSSNCSAALHSGSPSGAKQTSGRRKRSTSNLVPSSPHPHTGSHSSVLFQITSLYQFLLCLFQFKPIKLIFLISFSSQCPALTPTSLTRSPAGLKHTYGSSEQI